MMCVAGDDALIEAAWYRALTLSERLALPIPPAGSGRMNLAKGNAERRMSEWRAQSPFGDEELFSRRLELEGLDEQRLRFLLSEVDEDLQSRCPESPAWLAGLKNGLLAWKDGGDLPRGADIIPLVRPWAETAYKRLVVALCSVVRTYPGAPFYPDRAAALLFAGESIALNWMLSRTVALELRVAKLTGRLSGDTPEERYRSFLSDLAEPEAKGAFFAEYPVLARLVTEHLEHWVEASHELLERLAADYTRIRATFSPDRELGALTNVLGGLGDRHRGGRSVRILEFSSGLRLVYKPRSMQADIRFGDLLDWLNERGAPSLRVPKVLDCGTYGWAEAIAPQPCAGQEELVRFYRRQGALLALLYALNANDVHRENLIASGEHPLLIDLETLCSGDFLRTDADRVMSASERDLNESVVAVMLLPYSQVRDRRESFDFSGLGGESQQLYLIDDPVWHDLGTDEMQLTYRRARIAEAANRPTLSGEEVDVSSYRDEIVEGFVTMYGLLRRHREELLGEEGPLARLADIEVRSVFRPTQFYNLVLRESYHPDLLRDALDRDRHFDRLWFGIERSICSAPLTMRLIHAERDALWRGDIPYFSTRADSHDAWTDSGERIPDVFRRTGIEVVRARFRRLGDEDLAWQVWLIRGSLTSRNLNAGDSLQSRYEPMATTTATVGATHLRLLDLAAVVAQRLVQLARRAPSGASWVGLTPLPRQGWHLRPLGLDLYSGAPGVALFLAHAGALLKRDDLNDLAGATLATLRWQIAQRSAEIRSVGGFDGWGGLVYTWIQLAALWQREDFLDEALGMLVPVAGRIDLDEDFDMLFGAAGGIVPLLHLYRATGSDAALDLACRMGDRLVARAQPMSRGLAWPLPSISPKGLAGFSHGASGIALALLALHEATGKERYQETACEALAFEESLFSAQEGNWPDLRSPIPDPPRYMAAWCHGATGIGLARLRMRQYLPAAAFDRDMKGALGSTLNKGFGWNHCLCHGDMGSLELLAEAARTSGLESYRVELEQHLQRVVASMEKHGFLCGLPAWIETPGLMEGLAGIGYGLLRLAAPDRIPSVMMLDPPPSFQSKSALTNHLLPGGTHAADRQAPLDRS